MRNFKKFLALVLAMLMVSACAVSVSAAFADQDKINATDYKDAVAMLANLGVVKGDQDGNFNPANTLRRDEAAVIVAKLLAGAEGQTSDWAAETCIFPDVTGAWSFAYINYVGEPKIMEGAGDGNFNPEGTLTIDQAIALALKIAFPKEARLAAQQSAMYPTGDWATYYISAAEELGLLDGIDVIYNYKVACPKGMFAQIAYNVFTEAENIQEGFGYNEVKATVDKVLDNKVVLKNVDTGAAIEVAPKLFGDALVANGITVPAEALKGCYFNFIWTKSGNTVSIGKIEVLSDVIVVTHENKYVDYYKENNEVIDGKLNILGTTYVVGVEDESISDGILGGTSTATYGTALQIGPKVYNAGEEITIPDFYKAFVYDDDKDKDIDRIVVVEYEKAYIECTNTTDGLYTINGTPVVGNDKDHQIVWTTNDVPADTVPVLVQKNYGFNDAGTKVVIDILKVADLKTGVFSGYDAVAATPEFINIDGAKVTFTAYTEFDLNAVKSYLGQTVKYYELDGKFIKFASVDNFVTNVEVLVDSVEIVDGKAVVSGYDFATLKAIDPIVIDGYFNNSLYTKAITTKWNTKKVDNADVNTTVSIGTKKDDGTFNAQIVNLTEGLVVEIAKLASGNYYVDDSSIAVSRDGAKLKVDGNFLYLGGSASQFVSANGAVVLVETYNIDDEKIDAERLTNTYADITYTSSNTFAEMDNVKYYNISDADNKLVALFVAYGATPVDSESKATALADGKTIVYIEKATGVQMSADGATYTYQAIDLFNKKVVEVQSAEALTIEGFYVYDGSALADTTGKWISTGYNVTVDLASLVKTIKAKGVVETTTVTYNAITEKLDTAVAYAQTGDEKLYDLSNTIIYNVDALYDANNALQTVEVKPQTVADAQANAFVFADGTRLILVVGVGA